MPVSLNNKEICNLFPLIDEIAEADFRQGVIDVLREIGEEMAFDNYEEVPKNLDFERHRPLVTHVNAVAEMAVVLADICKKNQGLIYDRDMLIAACLLHDGSKPVESEPDPDGSVPSGCPVRPVRRSELGNLMPHSTYVAHKVLARGMGQRLAHLLITHTHSCNVRGKGIEAALLFYSDFVDTDCGIVMAGEGNPMFSQRWTIDR